MRGIGFEAINTVMALSVGDVFKVRGREYTFRQYGGDYYADRAVFKVWNAAGKPTKVTVRNDAAIEVLESVVPGLAGCVTN